VVVVHSSCWGVETVISNKSMYI